LIATSFSPRIYVAKNNETQVVSCVNMNIYILILILILILIK